MNYDEFKQTLKEEIQARCSKQINFMEDTALKSNEVLESLCVRVQEETASPVVYPEKLYADYQNGVPVALMADRIAASVSDAPVLEMPDLTPQNAERSVSFSLLNKEKNGELLKDCPHRIIHDMAAIPRWHISDEASFIVNNRVMEQLQMTKEEILDIAQKNTEEKSYTCQSMKEAMKEVMMSEGMSEELVSELLHMPELPFFVISNKSRTDGSCAILSDRFMQQAAEQTGMDEMYLLPSSRHEMIAISPKITGNATDARELKEMVMSVNSDAGVMRAEDFLSNSVYKYDAKTHSLSMCDSMGIFHDKATARDGLKPAGKVRGMNR